MLDGGRERGYGSLSSSLIDGRSTHVNPEHINNGPLFPIHGVPSNVLGSTDHLVSSSSKDARPPASALGFLGPPLSKLIRKNLSFPLETLSFPFGPFPSPSLWVPLVLNPWHTFQTLGPLAFDDPGTGKQATRPKLGSWQTLCLANLLCVIRAALVSSLRL